MKNIAVTTTETEVVDCIRRDGIFIYSSEQRIKTVFFETLLSLSSE